MFCSGGFFVISLLPAIICLCTPLIPARRPFLRDNLFYILSCSLFFIMAYGDGLIQWYESLILLLGKLFQIMTSFELRNTYVILTILLSLCILRFYLCVWKLVLSTKIPRKIYSRPRWKYFTPKKLLFERFEAR